MGTTERKEDELVGDRVYLVGSEGLEPSTPWLRTRYSTIELRTRFLLEEFWREEKPRTDENCEDLIPDKAPDWVWLLLNWGTIADDHSD